MADHKATGYRYDASVPAAVVAVIIFAIITVYHLFLAFKFRIKYVWPLIIGLLLEIIGFVSRIINIKQDGNQGVHALSEATLVVAPAFYAAQCYMIVGRIMSWVGTEFAIIKHSRITFIFVTCDVLSILTQAAGAAMFASANTVSGLKRGRDIVMFGLVLQVVTFGIFMFLAGYFDWKSTRAIGPKTFPNGTRGTSHVRKLWWAFYLGAFLLNVRSIMRVVQFGSVKINDTQIQATSYLITHEWVIYILDALPMALAFLLFGIWHPASYLPKDKGPRLDGTFEPQSEGRKYICCGSRKQPRYQETVPMTSV